MIIFTSLAYIPPPWLQSQIMQYYPQDLKLITSTSFNFPETQIYLTSSTCLSLTIFIGISFFSSVWFIANIPRNEKFSFSLWITGLMAILIQLELHFLS